MPIFNKRQQQRKIELYKEQRGKINKKKGYAIRRNSFLIIRKFEGRNLFICFPCL